MHNNFGQHQPTYSQSKHVNQNQPSPMQS